MTWYEKNKVSYRKQVVARRNALKAHINALKGGPCVDCGGRFDPVAMDFDHRDPDSKSFSISSVGSNGWGLKKLTEEIAKCDLVCANCHRVRTKMRQAGGVRVNPGL